MLEPIAQRNMAAAILELANRSLKSGALHAEAAATKATALKR
jgi:hypothetical protein